MKRKSADTCLSLETSYRYELHNQQKRRCRSLYLHKDFFFLLRYLTNSCTLKPNLKFKKAQGVTFPHPSQVRSSDSFTPHASYSGANLDFPVPQTSTHSHKSCPNIHFIFKTPPDSPRVQIEKTVIRHCQSGFQKASDSIF